MLNEIERGSAAALIVEEEERLLARVEARVTLGDEEGETVERAEAADFDRELISLRDAMAEAKPEDLASLVEQMTRLAAIRERVGGARSLPVDVSSPYFAHMVLRQGPAAASDRRRDVLVGKRGFIDRRSNVQIVDWRNAPISQVYYRYDEGDDYEETVDGRTLAGVVEVRRNVSIHKARLRRIGSPQGTFVRDARGVWREAVGSAVPTLQGGQGSAARAPVPPPSAIARGGRGRRQGGAAGQQARSGANGKAGAGGASGKLGVHTGPVHRADKHLPEIAALIDREQFDLITSPSSGLVVLQGGAGSGKTTVALHRMAYLNFADRSRFRAGGMLFVVPSEALVRYVSSVLPALGVSGVAVTTYRAWARNTRQKLLPGSPGKYTGGASDSVVRLKKHPALLAMCEDLVHDKVVATEAALEAALAGAEGGLAVLARWRELEGMALVPRLRRVYRWLSSAGEGAVPAATRVRSESALKALGTRADDVMADWGELMTDRPRLTAGLVDAGAATAREIEALITWCTGQLNEPPEQPVDTDGQPIESVDGRAVDEDDRAGRLDEEDDALLLRLVQLKRGALSARGVDPIEYQHVAIDEAQDRAAVEVKVLVEATHAEGGDPDARSVTIAGDTAQRLVFDNHFFGWRELLEAVGLPAAVMRPLRLSYRSTAEVMQLARYILGPELAPEEPLYARPGAPVEVHELGGIGEAVAFLGDALRGLASREPTASVAVIARYPEQADVYHEGLVRAEVPSLRRVRRSDFRFEPGVDVTDVSQVKGLEFDYVVMVDVNAATYSDTVEARHLLHIGATRAAYQLWLIATTAPSPLLPPAE
ncbi:MAG TPA: ATP-binding domain-containing protein [Kofleriaceae bacterium]|nr:ATP-binding domain-containing protein [Kofleriaceae bacterium]